MSDPFDEVSESDEEKIDFRLFFENKECDECPMHLFDFDSDEWNQTKLRPRLGDRVVRDGTEMYCLGNNRYRELRRNEESVWDFSEPEAAKIEDVDYGRYSDPTDRRSDPHINPSKLIHTFRYF